MFGFLKKPKQSEASAFLTFCENNFQKNVDRINVLPSSKSSLSDISVFIWHDCPELGTMTAVSYGLSGMNKKEWIKGRPELMIRLDTQDESWAFSMAAFIESFREEKIFQYLTVLTTDEIISDESEMRGFFMFGPPLIEGEESQFQFGNALPINLAGFYPIYIEERDTLPRMGLDAFWHHEFYDPFSVTRPKILNIEPGGSYNAG